MPLSTVSDRLGTVQTDLNAITSSATFQTLLSLEGMNADKISEFMSSPVEIETETFYSVKNYGSSMTPFYTNLAIWVGGIVLIAILKMEVNRDQTMRSYGSVSLYLRTLAVIRHSRYDPGLYCLPWRCTSSGNPVRTSGSVYSDRCDLFLCIREYHLRTFAYF